MSNLQISIDNSKQRLAMGRAILAKATQPKMVFEPFTYENDPEHPESIKVWCHDQAGNEMDEIIQKSVLIAFVQDFYSDVMDSEYGGEHVQFVDTMPAAVYLEENISDVLIDFYKNKKS